MVLGVLYGSRTCEHDVSVVTALQAMQNVDQNKYELAPIYIDNDGSWYTGEGLLNLGIYTAPMGEAYDIFRCVPAPYGEGKLALYRFPIRGSIPFIKVKPLKVIDVALLAFHGVNGEDGSAQGLLEMYNVPYTSAGIAGSALGMDKIMMKLFFNGCGVPILPYVWFTRDEWKKDGGRVLSGVEKDLTYPVFVKPANLGSSIGISKATDRESLMQAIDVACAYDSRILVEQGLSELDEINCAAVGYEDEVTVSLCEMPVSWEEFLTFDEKYLQGNRGKGMENLNRKIPAPISDEMTRTIQAMTEKVFRFMNLKGVVRIDYMIDKTTGKLYINEVNTIPGSLAFYLFEPMGIPYRRLIDKMVDAALKEHAQKASSTFSYDSRILTKMAAAGLKGGKVGGKLGGKMGSKL